MKILGIESSCDETAAAVVEDGRKVLSNVIASQVEEHKIYGGVVPEIASRKHIEKINQVIEEALQEANVTMDDLDAIGVTYGPGLVGALLVGVAEAKAIAYAKKLPLVGVHHIEGHISANYIENKDLEVPEPLENLSLYATSAVLMDADSGRVLFEKNGFILKLDMYIFEEACKLLAKQIAEGIKPVPISTNFSRVKTSFSSAPHFT